MRIILTVVAAIVSIGSCQPIQAQAVPENISSLVKDYGDGDGDCRGLSPDNPRQAGGCERRAAAATKLHAAGYCRGKEHQSGFEYEWHVCAPGSIGWSGPSVTRPDPAVFRQIINYIFTGNINYRNPTKLTHDVRDPAYIITIIDQTNCVVQVETLEWTTINRKVYNFNNADIKSIRILRGAITGSGVSVLDWSTRDDVELIRLAGERPTPAKSGKSDKFFIATPGDYDRTVNAVQLMYQDYCKGKQSAF